MNGKRLIVFDIEGDSLQPTLLHCLCWKEVGKPGITAITKYEEMQAFLQQDDVIYIGHNIILFDIPVAERLLNIKTNIERIDTLPISWYKETKRMKHGLDSYGEEFGILKPKISDWQNLSIEQYIHRCSEDVRINEALWESQYRWLIILYDYDEAQVYRFLKYLEFKMDCVAEQEQIGIKLDVNKAYEMATMLRKMEAEKIEEIERAMPMVEIKKKKAYKDAVMDKHGFLSEKGDLFFNSIVEKDEGVKKVDIVEKVIGHKEPKANSHKQIKDWLFSLGWEPEHIQFKRNKETGEVKEIPQIGSKEKDGTLCPSVVRLFEREPKLELLEGLSIISHRLDIFDGFLRDQKNGRLYPSMKGLTNTLRLKHSVVVNLPDPDKKYGKDIRGCLLADEGYELCGTDLSGIEDSTKRHYIYKYDPEYVAEMNTPGYDPHLVMAVRAGMLTQEQADEHKLYEATDGKQGKSHSAVRKKAKVTNFSATYKVGAKTLSRNSGMALSESEKLLKIYWEMNNAILKVENNLRTKTIAGQDWVLNEVSGFWYSLRSDKDKFSTLNQGTAVYVFDMYVGYARKKNIRVALQYHDEFLFNTEVGKQEEIREKIKQSIKQVNDRLKLNITVGCSVKFGKTYTDCH
jgi:DNA polymerase I-like protein with 3'-5' exonuclease and polymerase domains